MKLSKIIANMILCMIYFQKEFFEKKNLHLEMKIAEIYMEKGYLRRDENYRLK